MNTSLKKNINIFTTNISRALVWSEITLSFFFFFLFYGHLVMNWHFNYLNLTQKHRYSCLIIDISNDTTRDISNDTTNSSTNLTNHVCETKERLLKRNRSVMFGVIGLTGMSFIIYMLYIYTRVLERRLLNTTTV